MNSTLRIEVKMGFLRNLWWHVCIWLDLLTRAQRDESLAVSTEEFVDMSPVDRAVFKSHGGWIRK